LLQGQLISTSLEILISGLLFCRRKDVTSFISGLAGEKVFNIMHILLMYLKKSSPFEKPLIAVLLLHFDLLVCSSNVEKVIPVFPVQTFHFNFLVSSLEITLGEIMFTPVP